MGLCHLVGMLVAPRMEGYVASVMMRGSLNADRLYSSAVFSGVVSVALLVVCS